MDPTTAEKLLQAREALRRSPEPVYDDFAPVTPNDDDDLDFPGFVSCQVDGDIAVITAAGEERTIPAGWAVDVVFPVLVSRVLDAGTTASNIYVFMVKS